MDQLEYKRLEKEMLKIPYKNRYRLLKSEKEYLKEIEITVPEVYKNKIKKRLQPNRCFEESIKFAQSFSSKEIIYCIGQFQQNKIYHAWIEFQDKDYCFDTTLQAFYQKEKYYEYRKIKKLYTRKANEILFLANKYELFGLYPEDYEILDSRNTKST